MHTHESQNKLARLLDQEITRINQQTNPPITSELLDKTTDLMNTVSLLRCFNQKMKIYHCVILVIIRFFTNKNIFDWRITDVTIW